MKKNFKVLNEREIFENTFDGFKEVLEYSHTKNGIERERLSDFNLLYKQEKESKTNVFAFIRVERDSDDQIIDISTQVLFIPFNGNIKMVARNGYFDASDEVGNLLHLEFDFADEANSILGAILRFKK